MSRRAASLAAALAGAALLLGCGSGAGTGTAPAAHVRQAIQSFTQAAFSGDATVACALMTQPYRRAFVARVAAATHRRSGSAGTCPAAVRRYGGLLTPAARRAIQSRLRISDVRVSGRTASARVLLGAAQVPVQLHGGGDRWLIAGGLGTAPHARDAGHAQAVADQLRSQFSLLANSAARRAAARGIHLRGIACHQQGKPTRFVCHVALSNGEAADLSVRVASDGRAVRVTGVQATGGG